MPSFVVDACIPISLSHYKLKYLKTFLRFMKETDGTVLMTPENFKECSQTVRTTLNRHESFEIRRVTAGVFNSVKDDCTSNDREYIQDNDYMAIALAIQERANYLVSNDWRLLLVAKNYKARHGMSKEEIILMHSANLFWYMHSIRKDLFDWKKHIGMNIKYYHHIEIPNTYRGVQKTGWSEQFAKSRFSPYAENVFRTMQQVK